MNKRKSVFVVIAVAVAMLFTSAVTWAAAGVLFGGTSATGSSLITVKAAGNGASSQTITRDTPAQTYEDTWSDVNLDGDGLVHGVTFTVPKRTTALVVMHLSGISACMYATTSTPPTASYQSCNLRLLLDGKPYDIVNGLWMRPVFGAPAYNTSQLAANEFASNVGEGTHTVTIQWGIVTSGPAVMFDLESVRLIVEVYRG
jgi:hypothetical protein